MVKIVWNYIKNYSKNTKIWNNFTIEKSFCELIGENNNVTRVAVLWIV